MHHQETLTRVPEERHIQTDIVKVVDKSTETSKQVDTKCTSNLPLQGLTGSEVWVESTIDYITRNDTILSEMRYDLDNFMLSKVI